MTEQVVTLPPFAPTGGRGDTIARVAEPGAPARESVDGEQAVTALFRLHYWPMVRLARQLVDDQETAEDVVQEAFLSLHRRWRALRDPEAGVDYVRSTVLNLCRSRVRRLRVRRRVERPETPATAPAAESVAVAHDDEERMARALARLPRRQREVLVLRYYVDLSEEQIAATLRISRGSVKTHASRGIRALESVLDVERQP